MKMRWVSLAFILPIFLIAVWMVQFAQFAFRAPSPSSTLMTTIEIQKGQNPNDIVRLLVSNGAIRDGKNFILLGKITRFWKTIKAGEYRVSPSMSPLEIFSNLSSGISIPHPVTVREGENMYEIAEELEAKGLARRESFIKLCKDSAFIASLDAFQKHPLPPDSTLEGYLFPDTYFFNKTMSEAEIARQMIKHFTSSWGAQEENQATRMGLSRHQMITLASIIEKETGAPEERPLIGSVFHNRLKKGMKLQSDPTTIYGMWERYKGKIHRSDLLASSPYNTYTVSALPAGPISNPGKEAIQAALFPANSPYYFFVSHNDGTHHFSLTYEEHHRAVQKFQVDPAARAGKSWRDRLKKSELNLSPH